MLTRRTVLSAVGAAAGGVGFMLALGWWRRPAPGLLPVPLSEMDFTLIDHRDTLATPQGWLGRPLLAFFGFTFCPDICPTTRSEISGWLENLGPDADRLTLALISVDPERDTPQVLAGYLANFDPRITRPTVFAVQFFLSLACWLACKPPKSGTRHQRGVQPYLHN